MKTILIIDEDLGFALWLGLALQNAGYKAFPFTNATEAAAFISEVEAEVDLLIVNPSLPGAISLADSLRRSRRGLKVLALAGEDDQQAGRIPDADATARKPLKTDQVSSAAWLGMVARLLARNCAAA